MSHSAAVIAAETGGAKRRDRSKSYAELGQLGAKALIQNFWTQRQRQSRRIMDKSTEQYGGSSVRAFVGFVLASADSNSSADGTDGT